MAQCGVSITKSLPWRDGRAEFSNVYHYNTELLGMPTEAEGELIIDRLRAIEQPIHTSDVQFVEGRLWGPTGQGPTASKMIASKSLAGNGGLQASVTNFYKEFALMIYWPLGRYGLRNRKQFLRKWIHPGSLMGVVSTALDGHSQISVTPPAILTYINDVTTLVVSNVPASPLELCTEEGKQPIGPGKLYPYLEHRQFGR